MEFARRVHLLNSAGTCLRCVHPEEAMRLLLAGSARAHGGKKIRAVELVESLAGHRRKQSRPPTLMNYMGQRYTFIEPLKDQSGSVNAYTVSLKRIDRHDRWAFILSLTDCLTPAQTPAPG